MINQKIFSVSFSVKSEWRVNACKTVEEWEMKMSIIAWQFECFLFVACLSTSVKVTLIVLEMLVHEEISSKTLRCLHNAKYQCTANQQDY